MSALLHRQQYAENRIYAKKHVNGNTSNTCTASQCSYIFKHMNLLAALSQHHLRHRPCLPICRGPGSSWVQLNQCSAACANDINAAKDSRATPVAIGTLCNSLGVKCKADPAWASLGNRLKMQVITCRTRASKYQLHQALSRYEPHQITAPDCAAPYMHGMQVTGKLISHVTFLLGHQARWCTV